MFAKGHCQTSKKIVSKKKKQRDVRKGLKGHTKITVVHAPLETLWKQGNTEMKLLNKNNNLINHLLTETHNHSSKNRFFIVPLIC